MLEMTWRLNDKVGTVNQTSNFAGFNEGLKLSVVDAPTAIPIWRDQCCHFINI